MWGVQYLWRIWVCRLEIVDHLFDLSGQSWMHICWRKALILWICLQCHLQYADHYPLDTSSLDRNLRDEACQGSYLHIWCVIIVCSSLCPWAINLQLVCCQVSDHCIRNLVHGCFLSMSKVAHLFKELFECWIYLPNDHE